MKSRRVLLLVAALVAGTLAVFIFGRSQTPRRASKVVLVTIDTLRAGRLGAYGYEKAPTSPVLDAWADDAVVFEHVFSQAPWTVPSLGSLFTGRFPVEAGVYTNRGGITPDLVTLPEIFAKHGFETVSFNTHVLLVNDSGGFRRGFDRVFPVKIRPAKRNQHKIPWTDTEPDLMHWLDEHAHDERFFVWIHSMDPHAPPTVGNPYLRESGWNRYDAEVRWVDEALRRILDKLEALGVRDEVLLVFTADHGEAFGEHRLNGHQDVMYDEVLQVPLILAGPGIAGGRRIAAPVALIDVFPTLLELAGLPVPKGTRGESLVPLIDARSEQRRKMYTFHSRYHFENGHHELALRDREWKLLLKTPPRALPPGRRASLRERDRPEWSLDEPDVKRELYHWSSDPGEKENLVEQIPEVVAHLEAVLHAWWRRMSVEPGEARRAAPELDAASQEALRALGYE